MLHNLPAKPHHLLLRLIETTIVALLLINAQETSAQTENYWSWSFNTHSTLLSGAVVAGNAGPSAIYYNPALIDPDNMSSLSLSANVVSMQFYRIENYAGNDIDASAYLLKVQPRFVSYVLPLNNDKLGLQVALVSPVSEEIYYSIDHTDNLDLVNRTPGEETYTGEIDYRRDYSDTWVGIGVSYKHSPRFSLGGSLFVSGKLLYHNYRQRASAYQTPEQASSGNASEPVYIAQNAIEEEVDYWYMSAIVKTGIIYRPVRDRFSIGLNITFPAIPGFGRSTVKKVYSRSNVFDDSKDGFTENHHSTTVEEDNSDIRIKDPFAVALGLQYTSANQRTSVSATAEYFHQLDPYTMIGSSMQMSWVPAYISEETGSKSPLSYEVSTRAVLNGGLGLMHDISPVVTFLGGFRTDFSAGASNTEQGISTPGQLKRASINKYHLTSGVSFNIRRVSLVTGVQYTIGRDSEQLQTVNFATPEEYIPETDQALEGHRASNARTYVDEVALFLGMQIGLERKNNN